MRSRAVSLPRLCWASMRACAAAGPRPVAAAFQLFQDFLHIRSPCDGPQAVNSMGPKGRKWRRIQACPCLSLAWTRSRPWSIVAASPIIVAW